MLGLKFRELQDDFIIWCFHNYYKYPTTFRCLKIFVTISTYYGIYRLSMMGYRWFMLGQRFGRTRASKILKGSQRRNHLYLRLG